MTRATPLRMAWASVTLFATAATCSWVSDPHHATKWLVAILGFPALWGFVELRLSSACARSREMQALRNFHRKMIAAVGLFLTYSLLLKLALSTGARPEWMPIALRMRGLLVGTGVLVWGNQVPKLLSPWGVENEPFDWQRVHRFGGTAAFLGGIALLLVWLTFPLAEAKPASQAIMATLFILLLSRKLISAMSVSRRQIPPSPHHPADDWG